MRYVTDATYVDGYKLRLAFNDRTQGVVDLADVIKHDHRPIFNQLMDTELFKRFKVDADTVVWENGLDLAPEFLFQQLKHA